MPYYDHDKDYPFAAFITNVKGMWSEKKQSTYDAAVILDDTGGKYINFKLEFLKKR